MNDERIKNLLNQVKQIIKSHKECANKQGESFNIFKILRMERKEVETHSRFIYELLNLKGSHGQGDIFLKSFAKIVLGSEVSDTAIDPQREDLTSENRRIDFTLETSENVIGIEMKIDAGDQSHQLYDYQQELQRRAKKGQGTRLFYLTLDGIDASKDSLGGLAQDSYERISFKGEILKWIEDCIKQSAEKSVLREALIQYKILIEKLTGQNMDMDTEIAELIKDKESFEAAQAIEKGLVQAKINFKINFWEDLLKDLGGGGFIFGNKYKEWNDKHQDIKASCSEYYKGQRGNTEQGIIYELDSIRISLVAYHNLCFNIDSLEHQIWHKKCIEKEHALENKKGKFFPKNVKHLNFRKFNSILIDELSGDKRKKTIKNLADEFKELVKKLESEN
jgi:hypothetical protein